MLLEIIQNGFSISNLIFDLLAYIPVVLLSLSIHEWAHGYAAYKLGDLTPKYCGRLTLNPFKHLDLLGTLSMLLLGIGWAKPVPINPNNFQDRKKGMALTAFAGPLSNLILAFISRIIFTVLSGISADIEQITGIILLYITFIFYLFSVLNIYLAVFNLIPIPPFDGSRLLLVFLPEDKYFGIMKYEKYIKIIFIALLISDRHSSVLSTISNFILSLFDKVIGLVQLI